MHKLQPVSPPTNCKVGVLLDFDTVPEPQPETKRPVNAGSIAFAQQAPLITKMPTHTLHLTATQSTTRLPNLWEFVQKVERRALVVEGHFGVGKTDMIEKIQGVLLYAAAPDPSGAEAVTRQQFLSNPAKNSILWCIQKLANEKERSSNVAYCGCREGSIISAVALFYAMHATGYLETTALHAVQTFVRDCAMPGTVVYIRDDDEKQGTYPNFCGGLFKAHEVAVRGQMQKHIEDGIARAKSLGCTVVTCRNNDYESFCSTLKMYGRTKETSALT